ncbi:MAG: Threonine/Serine exporter, ThrE [Anaerosporomusa subterranea]|nr:Threonine/Serine exporter, ThrE [Anaerosporomusa subterranea]
MLIYKAVTVFCMGLAIGVLYRIPRAVLPYASGNGVFAWLVVSGLSALGAKLVLATFFGSLAAALSSELLARHLKKPATIFLLPGFIPLVPGREAYATMANIVNGHYTQGVAIGVQTVLIGGAIAFGIFASTTVYRLAVNYKAGIK